MGRLRGRIIARHLRSLHPASWTATPLPFQVAAFTLSNAKGHSLSPPFFLSFRLLRFQLKYLVEAQEMALDWSACPAVESVHGKVSGAWVFRGTRLPVATIFENLEDGLTVEEIMEQFDVTREQINAVLDFAARSLEAPVRR